MNQTSQNIVFNRLALTISILLFIRLGTFLPVPNINHSDLAFYIQYHSFVKSLVSTFSGDDTFVIGLFTLNLFPYINASVLMQLILGISPKFAKLQKEGDLEGRRLINKWTRFITFILAMIQSITLAFYLKRILFEWDYRLAFEIVVWLTTGAMIVLWLSQLITDYGLGNGTSMIIYTNIVSNLPNLTKPLFLETSGNLTTSSKIGLFLVLLISFYGIVFLQEGVKPIVLISSKQLNQGTKSDFSFIPLRFNQAGVMPIILTTSVLVIPNYINNLGFFPKLDFPINFKLFSLIYWISYFVLILNFSSFYSSIVLNPKDISDQLQKMAVTIPGVRPGLETTFYLKQTMNRVTLIGGTMLATLAIVPNLLESQSSIEGFKRIKYNFIVNCSWCRNRFNSRNKNY